MRAGLVIEPFPPPGFTNFFVGGDVPPMPPLDDKAVGDSVDSLGEGVKPFAGQSFVHIARLLQYVGLGPQNPYWLRQKFLKKHVLNLLSVLVRVYHVRYILTYLWLQGSPSHGPRVGAGVLGTSVGLTELSPGLGSGVVAVTFGGLVILVVVALDSIGSVELTGDRVGTLVPLASFVIGSPSSAHSSASMQVEDS